MRQARVLIKSILFTSLVLLALTASAVFAFAKGNSNYVLLSKGEDFTLVAESKSNKAVSSFWVGRNGDGIFPITNGEKTDFVEGDGFVSKLTVKNPTEDDITTEYYCFFSGDCENYCSFIPYLIPTLTSGGNTDCLAIKEGLCGVCEVINSEILSAYPYEKGWYFADGGEYTKINGDRFYICDNLLMMKDVKSADGKTAVAYCLFDKDGNLVSKKDFTVSVGSGNATPSTTVQKIKLGFVGGECISFESDLYTVTDYSENKNGDETDISVTVKCKEGYSFQYKNYKINGMLGKVVLSAATDKTPSYMTDTITLSGKKITEEKKDILSVEYKTLTFTNGQADLSYNGSLYSFPSYFEKENGKITASAEGEFFALDGGKVVCYKADIKTTRTRSDSLSKAIECKIGTYLEKDVSSTSKTVYAERGNLLSKIGLTLSNDGKISGVPTTEGKYSVSVLAVKGNKITEYEVSVTAYPQKDFYTVSFVKNGGKGSLEKITVNGELSTFTVPECLLEPPSNKTFLYWSYNGKKYIPGTSAEIYCDITLTAIYGKAEKTDTEPQTSKDEADETTALVTDKTTETEKDTEILSTDGVTTATDSVTSLTAESETVSDTSSRVIIGEKQDGSNTAIIVVLIGVILAISGVIASVIISKIHK